MSIEQKLVDDLLDATERVLKTVTFERETETFYALKNLARARRRVCYALGRSMALGADELKGELIMIEMLRSSVLMLEQSEHQIRTTYRITHGKPPEDLLRDIRDAVAKTKDRIRQMEDALGIERD